MQTKKAIYLNSVQREDFQKRLNKVYVKIRKNLNAIARQNYLCCSSCASSALSSMADEKNKKSIVFSHKQDKSSIYHGYMPIRYGTLEGTTEEDQILGQQIVGILREEGLSFDWNGNPNQVIKVIYIP